MNSSTTKSFRDAFQRLPEFVRHLAVQNYRLWRENPQHPSLHFKKVGNIYWSIRIGLRYRALAIEVDGGFRWFWIGSHAEYERLINRSQS